MSLKILIPFVVFSCLLFSQTGKPTYIDENKDSWKPFFVDTAPQSMAAEWFLPFQTTNRKNLKTVHVISTFGAARLSYLKGHIHTGIDVIPAKPGTAFRYVYPMANGVVCSIHLDHPYKTVVIAHKLPNNEIMYTSYKHFQETYVSLGQQVTPETKIARLYTRAETKPLNGNYDHLHLEIRKKFDDYGVASWATLTKDELNLRFFEPWDFIKKNVK